MIKVRFVEGSATFHETLYDADWPVCPRVGEYLSITSGTRELIDWKITRVMHEAGDDETHIRAKVWIERARDLD